jgi:L-lactate utilization protein LutC
LLLTSSHQYAHLRHHQQEKWDDLKIELLEGEDAAKVKDRMAEALSLKKAQRSYIGFSCAQCGIFGDVVTLSQHVQALYVFTSR